MLSPEDIVMPPRGLGAICKGCVVNGLIEIPEER